MAVDPKDCPTCQEWEEFDLPGLLAEARNTSKNPRLADRNIAAAWAYHEDLVLTGHRFGHVKTWCEYLISKRVMVLREAGERSAEVAAGQALQEPQIFEAKMQYRVAEQRITSDREALDIIQARLDDLRTQAADRRAGDEFHAKDRSRT